MPLITLDHVSFAYRDSRIIADLSAEFERGKSYRISGPSGMGKTTLLRLIMGLEKPSAGQIVRQKGLRFSAAFQEDRLLPGRTLLENLLFAAPGGADPEEAKKLLAEMGLQDAVKKMPQELSGGMARRAAAARALFAPSDVLILDEPFSGLDEETALTVRDTVLRHQNGRTLILSTHQAEFAPEGEEIEL